MSPACTRGECGECDPDGNLMCAALDDGRRYSSPVLKAFIPATNAATDFDRCAVDGKQDVRFHQARARGAAARHGLPTRICRARRAVCRRNGRCGKLSDADDPFIAASAGQASDRRTGTKLAGIASAMESWRMPSHDATSRCAALCSATHRRISSVDSATATPPERKAGFRSRPVLSKFIRTTLPFGGKGLFSLPGIR